MLGEATLNGSVTFLHEAIRLPTLIAAPQAVAMGSYERQRRNTTLVAVALNLLAASGDRDRADAKGWNIDRIDGAAYGWYGLLNDVLRQTRRWREQDSNPRSPSTASSVHSGACDATHAAIVKPRTPDRSRLRAGICVTPERLHDCGKMIRRNQSGGQPAAESFVFANSGGGLRRSGSNSTWMRRARFTG
jgi:hypothetical protein